MKFNWLATTAVALVIGSGAVIAQTQSEQKREETPRAQAPASKDQKAKEKRGEAASPAERKQAQEPKDTKQPAAKQTQDNQQKRGEPSPAAAQQNQEQQKGHDTKQATEPKQKQDNQARDSKQPEQKNQARDTKQPEQKNQARDSKQPSDTKQQTQQQPATNQAAQPSTRSSQPSTPTAQQPSSTPSQQSAQPGNNNQTRQGQTGQNTDPNRPGTSTSVTANDPQRTQIIERLRRDRSASNQNINIRVNIGERLPPRVRARPLPPDIVRIEPRYRGYEYTVIEDQVYIVEPRTKKVVDVIREPGASTRTTETTTFRSGRVSLTTEQRETLKQSARRISSPVAGTPSGGTSTDSSCLTLQPVPEDLVRANPELSQYRMLAIGDQVVLVDPREQKVVEVVE